MTDNALHNAPLLSASQFFSRAQKRLTLDVPAGLDDPHVIPQHDEPDTDPAVVMAIAAVPPIRPAAVLVPTSNATIALCRRFVEPIGYLDIHMTPFGYRIVPVLARVRPGFALRLNRDEADDAFEVPLAFLMTPQNHRRESCDWNGFTLSLYAMQFGRPQHLGRDRGHS
jgi:hypothetical protein